MRRKGERQAVEHGNLGVPVAPPAP
jgi:hypothetical protein